MRTLAVHWCVILALGAALRAGAGEPAAKRPVLTILNWPTYLDAGLVDKFERQEQVEVRELFFETDADRDVIMMENEGRGCDLVLVDDCHVAAYIRQGWLQPLRTADIPNLVHLDEAWRDAFPGAREYGVPYSWGVLGIVYRADQVKTPPRRWMDLFRPADDIKGRILMIEDPKELIGMALKALGRDVNSGRREDLEAADRLLQEQKPFVGEYSYIMTSTNSQLLGSGISVAMAYNGDALAVGSLSTNLVFVYPAEGSVMFCDFWCVPLSAEQPELAHKFLNFLQEPAQAARAAQYIHFATPNKAAEKLLPPSFLTNRGVYPSGAYLEKCAFLKEVDGAGQSLRNRIFDRITGESAAP